jgi:hypothetical protein
MIQIYKDFKEYWTEVLSLLSLSVTGRYTMRRVIVWANKHTLLETTFAFVFILFGLTLVANMLTANLVLENSGLDRAEAVRQYTALATRLETASASFSERRVIQSELRSHPALPFVLSGRERVLATALLTLTTTTMTMASMLFFNKMFPKFHKAKKFNQYMALYLSLMPALVLSLLLSVLVLSNGGMDRLVRSIVGYGFMALFVFNFFRVVDVGRRAFKLNATKYYFFVSIALPMTLGFTTVVGLGEFESYVPLAKEIDGMLKGLGL